MHFYTNTLLIRVIRWDIFLISIASIHKWTHIYIPHKSIICMKSMSKKIKSSFRRGVWRDAMVKVENWGRTKSNKNTLPLRNVSLFIRLCVTLLFYESMWRLGRSLKIDKEFAYSEVSIRVLTKFPKVGVSRSVKFEYRREIYPRKLNEEHKIWRGVHTVTGLVRVWWISKESKGQRVELALNATKGEPERLSAGIAVHARHGVIEVPLPGT